MSELPLLTFVIDTNSYAGNFERQMCGYMTGDGGEYGYKDVDAVFHAEVGDDHPNVVDLVEYRVNDDDDVPVHAPVRTFPNPRWFNNGTGGYFRLDDPEAETKALLAYKKSTIGYAEDQIKRVKASSRGQESIDRGVSRFEQQIKKANATTKVTRHPAYTSVGIFLRQRPTAEQIAFLKDRAQRFVEFCRSDHEAAKWLPNDLQIEGFRLIEETLVETSVEL